jgi:hypothetical protein
MGCKRSEVQILSPRQTETLERESLALNWQMIPRRKGMQNPLAPTYGKSPERIPSYLSIWRRLLCPKQKQEWSLGSVALRDAFTDFILSRQTMNCMPSTLAFYSNVEIFPQLFDNVPVETIHGILFLDTFILCATSASGLRSSAQATEQIGLKWVRKNIMKS